MRRQPIHRVTKLLVLIALVFIVQEIQAQQCNTSINPTTSTIHYRILNNGTIHDSQYHLVWMQCSIGQTGQKGQCFGTPETKTWEEAQASAKASRFAGYADWRLPIIHELSRITELRCQQPAINLMLFPGTLAGDYWTATSFINNINMAWLVHFTYGENHTAKKINRAAIRLVRSTDH